MSNESTNISQSEVREYLEILMDISRSFNGEEVKTQQLSDMQGEKYNAACKRIVKLAQMAGIRLGDENLTAVQRQEPPRDFTNEYLVRGYELYLADRIVSAEAQFLVCTAKHSDAVSEYRSAQERLNALAKDRRCDRNRQQRLQGELRTVQSILKAVYKEGDGAIKELLGWMNAAYARQYQYAHVPLQGPLMPVRPRGYDLKAQVEAAENEFMHSIADERISRVINLNMRIG